MRIWDLPPSELCRQHLLGEHRELHALWSIITKNKKAYSNHPETLRWKGKLHALYLRHETLVSEMQKRGYNHNSPLDPLLATGESRQDILITSIDEQKDALRKKGCNCKI
ncbi:pyrimidine dimer DNA glycosylase/endonuclease V [Methanohalophilus portucalensis]|uniref:Pyrimidine dimer DNA glycosylase n=2 Tax=Methanohalophilus portucalensis TaxID=39664 RepID=A0A1L9C4I4_9EURY|nr:pyrimidine dimer DNA glycosylase/endonuclease V [Methanohalophilus portucalensis]ATU07747.1 pyrimidine dimer DNA glycosylase [Methanohalophilus portucalensis]OJH49444.1 hypothetical protein MPF_1311 [Methanohalophilus portucalensis FDF-1]RNI11460.1 pyrimidine dimer DNA glycosylase [Methanohalophilus portucalensis FDF-1]SMH40921.1 Pyrimidine dimer DNA glycosylase /DNA-(apurinic or apyrimidinic site) lyase [Methanohalophilus portucalensis FDF-1]